MTKQLSHYQEEHESTSGPDSMKVVGGILLFAVGAGLLLSNPKVRRYMSGISWNGILEKAWPDVARYMRMRAM